MIPIIERTALTVFLLGFSSERWELHLARLSPLGVSLALCAFGGLVYFGGLVMACTERPNGFGSKRTALKVNPTAS